MTQCQIDQDHHTKAAKKAASQPSVELPEGLRKAYVKLTKVFAKQYRADLANYYEAGTILEKIYLDHEACPKLQRQKIYGEQIVETLAHALQMHPRTLYDCHRFAKRVSRAEYDQISRLPIRWSHVRQVLGLLSPEARIKWLERSAVEHWSAEELADAVVAEHAAASEEQARERRQRSLPAELARCTKVATQYHAETSRLLQADGDDSLVARIHLAPPDMLTAEIREQAADALKIVQAIRLADAEAERSLGDIVEWIDGCIRGMEKQRLDEAAEEAATRGGRRPGHRYVPASAE